MILAQVVSRDEWLAARVELLATETDLTRARDVLNAERRLPMVRIDTRQAEHERAGTAYYFEGQPPLEQPGTSFFLREGDYFLDLTALGRQEEWEEPKGRAGLHASSPDFAV